MRVAVIVPCFNDGATVEETVASVLAQEPCELVVVDDGSTDPDTHAAFARLEERGVSVLRQENQGLSAARNAGLAATSARYVLPLDADDALAAGALTALADALDAQPPAIAAAWGTTTAFGEVRGSPTSRHLDRLDPWRITYFNGLPYAALLRRDAVLAAGGWALRGGYEDWDLWMSLAELGYGGRYVPVPALRYRVGSGRMWSESATRHAAIHAELRRRHHPLFDRRRSTWAASEEPWHVRLLVPLIARLPVIAERHRQALYEATVAPRHILLVLRGKAARARRGATTGTA